MVQELIPKKNWDLILEARAKFTVVIDSARDKKKMVIYGERENVQKALKFLENQVGDSTATRSSTPKESTRSSSKGAANESFPNSKSTTKEKVTVNRLSCVLYQNLNVCVYQGDITKETVDVIVNPANEDLNHIGGAAAAIVKAGGSSIQDASNEIMKKRRRQSLKPGEVEVTRAGNLPCNMIIHAVGPRWGHYLQKDRAKTKLYEAVSNCLVVANKNGATNISIPAISSGIFGVPVTVCAEVLFAVVIDFSQNMVKTTSLREVRFVNIDDKTSQVFAKEMMNRFGSSVKRENIEIFHSKHDGLKQQQQQRGLNQNQLSNAKGAGMAHAKKTLLSHTGGHSTSSNDNTGKEDDRTKLKG
jgi:O-acetyl-ADP-ribose deacetylase (regulator of RNase III)